MLNFSLFGGRTFYCVL